MVENLIHVLEKLQRRAPYVVAHQGRLFETAVKRCGGICSGQGMAHDPELIRGVMVMRRPETVGQLMLFLRAVNWERAHLPRFTDVKASSLQTLVDERLVATRRTKDVANWRPLMDEAGTPEGLRSWEAVPACGQSWRSYATRSPGSEHGGFRRQGSCWGLLCGAGQQRDVCAGRAHWGDATRNAGGVSVERSRAHSSTSLLSTRRATP